MSAAVMDETKTESTEPAPEQRNLRVTGPGSGFHFGGHKHGTVLPQWSVERCGRTAEQLVADGLFEWTTDDVVVDLRAPEPQSELDETAEAMSWELDGLRRKNAELKGNNALLEKENRAHAFEVERLTKELGRLTAEVLRLKNLASALELKVKEQAEELDRRPPLPAAPEEAKAPVKPAKKSEVKSVAQPEPEPKK